MRKNTCAQEDWGRLGTLRTGETKEDQGRPRKTKEDQKELENTWKTEEGWEDWAIPGKMRVDSLRSEWTRNRRTEHKQNDQYNIPPRSVWQSPK